MKIRINVILSSLIFLLVFTGCQEKTSTSGHPVEEGELPAPLALNKMSTFTGEAGLEMYLKNQLAMSPIPRSVYDGPSILPEETDATAVSASGARAESFSETNIQEQGVDESDKVKTDGDYFYVAQAQQIRIVQAAPPDAMKTVSTIPVKGHIDSLYLFKHILIALYVPENGTGHPWAFNRVTTMPSIELIGLPYWLPVKAETGVLVLDISNPVDPKPIKNTILEGSLAASRLVDGKLHLVMRFLPELPPLQITYDGTDEDFKKVVAENERLLGEVTLEDLLPDYQDIDSNGTTLETGELLDWRDFYRPSLEGGGSIVTLTTFNLKDASLPFDAVGLVADIHTLYASTESIYLTATRWKNEPFPTASEDPVYDLRKSTVIHKLDISGDKVVPQASGFVWGRILNQFSLGEFEGVLRIATTTGFLWGSDPTSRNHLFTLRAADEHLNIIGKIENIAPGERIYSARFNGERGFLVTFVEIDPLFTIDLSDPAAPKIAGELKVPGYSDYIHPLGDNHLITIGKDAKEEGGVTWYQGMQLSIFDISDFTNPKLLHQEKLGDRGTHSEALHNHKAFTYWAEQGLLALPVGLNEFKEAPGQPWKFGQRVFEGLYVYDVSTDKGFDFLGRIKTRPFGYWTRGIFIDKTVYAVQEDGISNAEITDIPNTIHSISLNEER